MFYLSFNFDFYVSKIMHLWVKNLPRKQCLRNQGRTKGEGWSTANWLKPPSNFIAGRPKAALLFCLLLVVLFSFFPGSFYCCCVYYVHLSYAYSSIEATCPLIPAARFAFHLCFICFVFVVRSCFVWWTKAEARVRVGRLQTSSSPQQFYC